MMAWAGFVANGTPPIVSIRGCLNSNSYVDMLSENLLPDAHFNAGSDSLFQQDNASYHVSCASRSRLEANCVKFPDWSAKSPALNPIANLKVF